jgi:hypothetical protein
MEADGFLNVPRKTHVRPVLRALPLALAKHLLRFAQEAAWREDNPRVPYGEQVKRVAKPALARKKSVDLTAYWQRHVLTT